MFLPTADGRSIWINNTCLWGSEEYHLVGALIGLAVYNNVLLNIHFPKIMYEKLLQKNDFKLIDIKSIDNLLYEGLIKLLEFEPKEQIENVFCRTFEVEWDEYGLIKKHNLIPNGNSIPVTSENRVQYVQKLVKWILVDSVSLQFDSLFSGFSTVINTEWTTIFSGGNFFWDFYLHLFLPSFFAWLPCLPSYLLSFLPPLAFFLGFLPRFPSLASFLPSFFSLLSSFLSFLFSVLGFFLSFFPLPCFLSWPLSFCISFFPSFLPSFLGFLSRLHSFLSFIFNSLVSFLPSLLSSFLGFLPFIIHSLFFLDFFPSLLSLAFFLTSFLLSFRLSFVPWLPFFLPSVLTHSLPSFRHCFLPQLPSCLRSMTSFLLYMTFFFRILPSFLYSLNFFGFLLCFLPFFLPSFLPSFLPFFFISFLPSFLPCLLPFFFISFLTSFLPSFLPSYLRS